MASTSSPIRFPMISNPPAIVTPVMLPPGRAMLGTSPRAIGSNNIVTIGIVVVAILKSSDRRAADVKNHVGMGVDDIAGQFGIAFGSPFSRIPFHPEVLALDV